MATFARLLRSLRCILGVWAPAETASSRLHLPNTLLREAVQKRYLRDSNPEKQIHLFLAVHLWRLTDPEGNETFTECDSEALADLPEHLILSGEIARLSSLLTNLRFSLLHVRLGLLPQLSVTFNLYHAASSGGAGSPEFLPEVGPFRDFIDANSPVLSQNPLLFWQQALNQPDDSAVCLQAHRLLSEDSALSLPSEKAPEGFRLIEWTNKPQVSAWTEGKVMVTPTVPQCVGISPSGQMAVVGTSEGYLHILDLDSGQEVRSLASSCDGISDCAFLSEGALGVTSFDGKIEAWSLSDGCRLLLVEGHRDRITGCTLNRDGKHLATCSWDRAVKVWAVAGGKLNVALTNPQPLNCVTFHPEGQLLATGSWDRTVRIWNWVTASLVRVLQGHPASVRALSYTPSGDYLASASLQGDVRLWSAASGLAAGGYQAHRGPVTGLRYIAEGHYLLSTGEDHQVRIWSGTLGQACGEYSTDTPSPALCVSVTKTGALMAVGYHNNQVKIFHLETGAVVAECELPQVPLRCLQWLHGEEVLASGSDDNFLRVWRLQGSRLSCVHCCRGHTRPLVSLSHSERFLASTSDDFTILLWTLAELIDREYCAAVFPACILRGHSDSVTCCSFSPDGLQLVTGSKDKSLLFWDLETLPGRISRCLHSSHRDWITGCSWAPRYVASCSNDGTVRLWDPDTGECIRELKGHTSTISGVSIMADLVLSVSGSGDLVVWKESGSAVTTIRAHPHRINQLAAFSKPGPVVKAGRGQGEQPGQLIVVTASDDGTVRLWNPLLADEVSTLTGHSAPVNGAAAGDRLPLLPDPPGLTEPCDYGRSLTGKVWSIRRVIEAQSLPSAGHPLERSWCLAVRAEKSRSGLSNIQPAGLDPTRQVFPSGSRMYFTGEKLLICCLLQTALESSDGLSKNQSAHKNRISGIVFLSENNFAVGSFDKSVSIWTLHRHQQTDFIRWEDIVRAGREHVVQGGHCQGQWRRQVARGGREGRYPG
ncbi:telomerase protein component 1-like [Heterodontus francisci]|uniref:telomerase protein component 1-like n=1 Tax=Heterodontus francisci TaxID=7792 RepID=UPI00355C0527